MRRLWSSVPSGKHCGSAGLAGGGHRGWVGTGRGMDYSETVVTLMITVMASAAAVRSTTAVADARDTARAFLEGLQQPACAAHAHP